MRKSPAQKEIVGHFNRRAAAYSNSACWVNDPVLLNRIAELSHAGEGSVVLDLGTGTGCLARSFRGRVKLSIGLDLCGSMMKKAVGCADLLVMAPAEKLPFRDNAFDVCVCRQGLQFMQVDKALCEIYRVLKPGGRVVLCHLTSYGFDDAGETFFIQRLRNPARRNFFLPDDFPELLKGAGFSGVQCAGYITRESVKRWTENGAVPAADVKKILDAYKNASVSFRKLHALRFSNGDIFDSMKMTLVSARKNRIGKCR